MNRSLIATLVAVAAGVVLILSPALGVDVDVRWVVAGIGCVAAGLK